MNLQELRTLVDYHYWARDRLLEAVERLTPEQFTKDLGNSFRSIRDTLGTSVRGGSNLVRTVGGRIATVDAGCSGISRCGQHSPRVDRSGGQGSCCSRKAW